jgi:rare lipoprotein A (peptidoglycan hydrolase)
VVFGRRYRVQETSEGYREEGIASWYGWEFHGRKTSSGPLFNMFELTAAHKSLPLPTYVQVTNLENGRQLVVKVTDRGPFVGERAIDLSYAAADRLGMLEQGTARVEIVALAPFQFLPKLAARRAEQRELLASRQNRPEPIIKPAAIQFAREEPIRLAALDQSAQAPGRPQPQPESAMARVETPEPSTSHQNAGPESKPRLRLTVQIARARTDASGGAGAASAGVGRRSRRNAGTASRSPDPVGAEIRTRRDPLRPRGIHSTNGVGGGYALGTFGDLDHHVAEPRREPARPRDRRRLQREPTPNSVPPRPVLVESPIKTRER